MTDREVICTWPGCGLPDRLHGAPDLSRVTHSGHWFCDRTDRHASHRHGPASDERLAGLNASESPPTDDASFSEYVADKMAGLLDGDASESGQPSEAER